jgi:diguanylate cyclase (GGDEF)-like protein
VLSELRTLSEHDALTGAVNRRHMMALLNEELKRQRRAHRPFSVAMVDIDFFKRVNDDHGHAVGDLVLKKLVLMTREALRETDVIARWGGEEFLVLLPLLPGSGCRSLLTSCVSVLSCTTGPSMQRACGLLFPVALPNMSFQ